ncbi:hypothetical protein DSM104443_02070 [Usitatibacter rugosus]|uniref:Uncharacterized protein n=1 Tax=Usitatibacter rugosus TaxID=2732067 RepID=A0A6M4GUK1_9PROT|nr:hypothetical protein [Usitatibacter rugosus]QJR11000.1 hypothetical protein DSM104443_02070 [Usitatibacter rugosus]
MKKIVIAGAVALACAAGAAVAQEKLRFQPNEGIVFTPRYQAATTVGQGHCLLRVWVDDRATVYIRGDQIGVRTLSGKMARDEGSYCSGPLPANAENFRISSSNQPGGGRILDIDSPTRGNGYTGSVTIDDPRNGGQTYVLDVTWNGDRYVPPVASMDEEEACQATVRDQIRARNGARVDVDFRPNVRREEMGSGRERIRGGGWAQGRGESTRFGYECVVDDRRNRVISANYQVSGQGVDNIR